MYDLSSQIISSYFNNEKIVSQKNFGLASYSDHKLSDTLSYVSKTQKYLLSSNAYATEEFTSEEFISYKNQITEDVLLENRLWLTLMHGDKKKLYTLASIAGKISEQTYLLRMSDRNLLLRDYKKNLSFDSSNFLLKVS